MIDGLVEHLERHLGEIGGGWQTDPDGAPMPFQVVEYTPGKIDDAVIYSTLGLSEFELASPVSDNRFRIELMMVVPAKLRGGPVPGILLEAGRLVTERGEVPRIGDLFRNVPVLGEISTMETLYVGRPLYFPAEFAGFQGGGTGVSIVWLLPVSSAEADFIEAQGWQAFEKLMYDREDLDPVDFDRPSILP
jgi:suppressor of fused protein SUFU